MRGYGHYRQTLKKIAGHWVISKHYLTRLLVERGAEKISS
jgi:hypothetical protein